MGALVPDDRIDSWKAIAAYLNRDIRTVRRWEALGLPVKRVPGGRGVSVFAFKTEIDAWLKASGNDRAAQDVAPEPAVAAAPATAPAATRGRGLSRQWIGVAAAIAIVGAIVVVWRLRTPTFGAGGMRLDVTTDAVTALDAAGTELWRHRFDPAFQTALSEVAERWRVVQRTPPLAYVATSHAMDRATGIVRGGELLQFAANGAVQRTFSFADTIELGGRSFAAPWAITAFAVDDSRGAPRVAVAAHHYLWSPSVVAVLDSSFARTSRFVHDGWIEAVRWIDADHLLVGGFSQVQDAGLVGIVDVSKAEARAIKMVALPRTELNRVTASRFNRAVLERAADRIVARTIEMPAADHEPAEALYELSPQLDLVSASFSARYWMEHRVLEQQKKIDHGRDACPDRGGPRKIVVWLPESGWTPAFQ